MNMTSNCDVTNSAHQIQMTTICHRMTPPGKFSAYATAAVECHLFPLCKGLLTEIAEMALSVEEGVGTGAQLALK